LPILEEDFQELAAGSITHEQLEEKAMRRMEEHNREIQQLEIPPEDLYHIFNKELRSYRQERRIVTLEDIAFALNDSDFLRATGRETREVDGQHWIEVQEATNWGGLYTRYALTASQSLYDQGVSDKSLPLKFASYGEPAFDELVEEMTADQYRPPGVIVVEEHLQIESRVWSKTAVLAMTRNQNGVGEAISVESFSHLKDLQLDLYSEIPEQAVEKCRTWLREQLGQSYQKYRERCQMLRRHKEIGDANKAFMYMLACGLVKSAQRRTNVRDPEKPNQVIAAAQDLANEDRTIILDINFDHMSQTQKRELIVRYGAEQHSSQWRSTPHFRQAAMHVIRRERGQLRSNGDNEVSTSQLLNNLWKKAENLLDD